ncbi:hypothetical protein LOAG_05958 [Loa loa]|uniref:Uncharacterized protein n=1 Tax=Loa loa TaxID=7209 RepID=A0A1S0U0H8_LOALO|nr:hypothetical protein LOAG_05958 [Loa loa]EFO22529.1 hypothetical protein LOAG_05958 [Loa loa]
MSISVIFVAVFKTDDDIHSGYVENHFADDYYRETVPGGNGTWWTALALAVLTELHQLSSDFKIAFQYLLGWGLLLSVLTMRAILNRVREQLGMGQNIFDKAISSGDWYFRATTYP